MGSKRRAHGAPGSRATVRDRSTAITVTPTVPLDPEWWLGFYRVHPEAFQAVEALSLLGFDMSSPQSPAFQDIVLEETERGRLYRQVLRLDKAHRARQLKQVVEEG